MSQVNKSTVIDQLMRAIGRLDEVAITGGKDRETLECFRAQCRSVIATLTNQKRQALGNVSERRSVKSR